MENSKKIMYNILIIILFISCKHEIKNKNYITVEDQNILFKHFSFSDKSNQKDSFKRGDSIFFSNVMSENESILNNKIIDTKSFDILYNNIEDKEKVKNEYYLRGDNYYFKDKNYIYIYKDDIIKPIKPTFSIAGKANEYRVLGGSYLEVNNKIYCKGIEIENADIKTFKTAKMRLKNSEWFQTIAFDKNNIYIEDRKEDKSKLNLYKDDIIGINIDSLQKKYFPN